MGEVITLPTKVIVEKWSNFSTIIKCQKSNASYLLDFAGYKEVLKSAGLPISNLNTNQAIEKVVSKWEK